MLGVGCWGVGVEVKRELKLMLMLMLPRIFLRAPLKLSEVRFFWE